MAVASAFGLLGAVIWPSIPVAGLVPDGGSIELPFASFSSTAVAPPACSSDSSGAGFVDTSDGGTSVVICDGTNYIRIAPSVEDFSGFSDLINSEDTPFAAHIAQISGTGATLVFTVNVVGAVGGNSAVLEVLQDAVQLCTLTFDCGDAVGTINTTACAGVISAGATIKFQWDATGACTALPKGNAELSWK